jgi:hypothetical protein
MKNLIKKPLFYIAIALTSITFACSDDDDDDKVTPRNGGGNPQTEEGTLSATIDGVDKNSVIVSSFEATSGSVSISGLFEPTTQERLSIIVQRTTSTGTYDMSDFLTPPNIGELILLYEENDSTSYFARRGTFNLLVNDTTSKKIEATFNFVGYLDNSPTGDTIVVTNGEINTTY